MNTVIVMAVSRDRLPHPAAFRAEHASDFNELCQLVASHIAWSQRRRTARSRLDRRGRPGDGEMIAGRMEGAQAVAVVRIAQRHTEHGLELLVACPNASVVEAQ